jgi:hypothetical protein
VRIGPAEIAYLGSPAVTLPLCFWRYARHAAEARRKKGRPASA